MIEEADQSQDLEAESTDGDPGEPMCSSNFKMIKNIQDLDISNEAIPERWERGKPYNCPR